MSLGDLVQPGERFVAWRNPDGQIVMAPVVEVVRTPENAAVLDQIGAFLEDPSTGVRRERPQRLSDREAAPLLLAADRLEAEAAAQEAGRE